MFEFLWTLYRRLFGLRPEAAQPVPDSALPDNAIRVEDTDEGKLYSEMMIACPDCHLDPPIYLRGPEGGMCVNVFCGRCGAGFNVTPVIQIAEPIGNNPRYILPEYNKETGGKINGSIF